MPAFSTPLSLATARSLVRNLILERAADVGLVTDAELNDIINLAARSVWLRIATKYPDTFAQRSAANITVATGNVPFTSIVGGGGGAGNVFRILNASVGAVGAAENTLEQIFEFDKVTARQVYEPGVGGTATGLIGQPSTPYRWYVEGTTVYFTPQTTGNFDVRFQWCQQPQDMTADVDTIWGGAMATYHDTVVSLAAVIAETKDGLVNPAAEVLYRNLEQTLHDNFGQPRYALHDQPTNPYSDNSRNSRP